MDQHAIKSLIEQLVSTEGGTRVRMRFNSSEDETVSLIKIKAAELINLIEEVKQRGKAHPTVAGHIARNGAHAQTLIEDGAMNAVKAATYHL